MIKDTNERITITVNKKLLKQIDVFCEKFDMSRTNVINKAITPYILKNIEGNEEIYNYMELQIYKYLKDCYIVDEIYMLDGFVVYKTFEDNLKVIDYRSIINYYKGSKEEFKKSIYEYLEYSMLV